MGAVIKVDTRQQAGKHEIKNEWWALHGVSTVRIKLDFGDYQTDGSNISVDTKRSVDEIAQNINGKQHARFKRECQRAAAAGYRLVILIENDDGVYNFDGLKAWTNTHCRFCVHYKKKQCTPNDGGKCEKHGTRKPIQGERLAKAMQTMTERYGVRFEFYPRADAAKRICLLLGVEYETLCADCFRYNGGCCLAAYGKGLTEGPPQPVDGSKAMCDRGCPF
jgi:ribosome-associated protein